MTAANAPGESPSRSHCYRETCMSSGSGCSGVTAIIAACLVSATSMTVLFGMYSHWPFVLLGIFLGLLVGKSINR